MHIPEDDFERYVLSQLTRERMDEMETHILICQACDAELVETARFVEAMRAAAAKLRAEDDCKLGLVWRAIGSVALACYRLERKVRRSKLLRPSLIVVSGMAAVTIFLYLLGALLLWTWYDGRIELVLRW
jgi:anti-sigma factor RsiW